MKKFIKVNAYFTENKGEERVEVTRHVIIQTDHIASIEPRDEQKYIIHTILPIVYAEPIEFMDGKKKVIRNIDRVYEKFYIISVEQFEEIKVD
jgi:hypothetical protein